MNTNLEVFLKEFNKTKEQFIKTGYRWNDLIKIADDYDQYKRKLLPIVELISKQVQVLPDTHSVRYRIKETSHLIEKIIRRKINDPKSKRITVKNYKNQINDFAGMRILHTYKNQWESINEFIFTKFEINKDYPPIAYVAHDEDWKPYKDGGLEVFPGRDIGYRSIHYTVRIPIRKGSTEKCNVEIQVRTVFEEGWSEIDHDIRYPYELDNELLKRSMKAFNILARTADEMGSFARYLREDSSFNKKQKRELDNVRKIEIRNRKLIKKLERRISEIEKSDPRAAEAIRIDLIDYIENQESITKILFKPAFPELISLFFKRVKK